MKKFLKILLISLTSLLLIMIIAGGVVSWLIFTPEKLTPIVRKQATKYINCQSEIDEVELTFFSTFPQFGLKAKQLTLINSIAGVPNDTLLDVKEIIGIINIKALIKNNELTVSNFLLSNGSVNVYTDSNGNTNYDIFGNAASDPDTLQTEMIFKIIDIENVDLKNINVSYVDEMLHLKADLRRLSAKISGTMKTGDIVGMVDAPPFDLSLEYRPDESSEVKTEIHRLSVKIDGSVKSDVISGTVAIKPSDVVLYYESDSLTFNTGIRNLSAVVSGSSDSENISGSIRLEPCRLSFQVGNEKFLQDAHIGLNVVADAVLSRQFVQLKEASLSVNDLSFDITGTFENDTVRKLIATDLSYKFSSWPVKNIMALIPSSFSSYVQGIEADGLLSSDGAVRGEYSASSIPVMDIRVMLEKGTLRYSGFPIPLTAVNADVNVHTDLKDLKSYVRIRRFDAKTPKSSVKTTGNITHIFSDIHFDLTTDADLVLSEFASIIPDSMNITATGAVSGKVKTEFTMSQLTNMEMEKMKASGTLTLSDIDATYDSLSVKTDLSTIEFALPNHRALTEETQFVFTGISANTLDVSKKEGFTTSLKNAKISFEASDLRDTLKIPDILCTYKMEALIAKMDSGIVSVDRPSGNISVAPRKNAPNLSAINLIYNSSRIEAGLGQYSATIENLGLEVDAENDPAQKDLVLQWMPRGFIEMDQGIITMTSILYPVEIPGIVMRFDLETLNIEKGFAKIDHSDFSLSGKLMNVSSYIRGDSLLRGEFDFISERTDILQIMDMTSGIGYDQAEKEAAAQSGPYLVPRGMDILLHTDVGYVSYGANTNASDIKGDLQIYDGRLVFNDIAFATPAAEMRVTAQYITTRENQDKNHLYLGLDLHLLDIEIGALLRMIPLVDSLMPMLQSFGGKGEFHCAVETYVDSTYQVKPSTIRGAASISGTDMVLMDSEIFSTIAKSLRFNKKTENKVDSLSVEFIIFGPRIDVYPFLIVMDKYKAVISGRHNMETFNYNISVVQSPLPVRLAVDVTGTLDKWKPKIGRSKFPDFYRPASRRIVESKQIELRKMIRDGLKGQLKKE